MMDQFIDKLINKLISLLMPTDQLQSCDVIETVVAMEIHVSLYRCCQCTSVTGTKDMSLFFRISHSCIVSICTFLSKG